jgi:hypothetical protein
MSDQDAKIEANDVLASVRRLVSQTNPVNTLSPSTDYSVSPSAALGLSSEAGIDRTNDEQHASNLLLMSAEHIFAGSAKNAEARPQDAGETATLYVLSAEERVVDGMSSETAGDSFEHCISGLETAVGVHSQDWDPEDAEDTSPAALDGMLQAFGSVESGVLRQPLTDVVAGMRNLDPMPDDDTAPAVKPEPKVAPEAQADEMEPAGQEAGLHGDQLMQAMVSLAVREELNGPLGEHMTRNVRRLVRREIQNALAVKDVK